MHFDTPSKYEDQDDCVKVEKQIEKISYNESMICQETTGKDCYNVYETDFIPSQVTQYFLNWFSGWQSEEKSWFNPF